MPNWSWPGAELRLQSSSCSTLAGRPWRHSNLWCVLLSRAGWHFRGYLLWILPFAARARNPAFLYLCSAVVLSYALLYPVAGLPRSAVYALEYVPFAALLLLPAFPGASRRFTSHRAMG